MGREQDRTFEQFSTDLSSLVSNETSEEKRLFEGNNSIRFMDDQGHWSLVVERNPTGVGGIIEWALQENQEHVNRMNIPEIELNELVRLRLESILDTFGLELQVDPQSKSMYIELASGSYVFNIYPQGELIVGNLSPRIV